MPNRNGFAHEGIIDKLRFNLPILFDDYKDDFICIADEGVMARLLNGGDGKRHRPDLLLQCDSESIIIEVGHLCPDKWVDLDLPLIHISHNRAVGLITGHPTGFVRDVLESCRNILGVY